MTTQIKRLFLLIIGITVIFLLLYPFFNSDRLDISLVSNIMVVVAACWSYFNVRNNLPIRRAIGFSGKDTKLLAIVLFLFIIGAIVVMIGFKNDIEQYLLVSSWPNSVSWIIFVWIILFYIVVSIPLQEFIFRGYILSVFNNFFKNSWLAISLCSLLYGLAHLHYGLSMILITFTFGLLLGWLKIKTKRLTYPIITHIIAGLGLFIIYSFIK